MQKILQQKIVPAMVGIRTGPPTPSHQSWSLSAGENEDGGSHGAVRDQGEAEIGRLHECLTLKSRTKEEQSGG